LRSSYENHESIFEDFFRIKIAGSSNYRGATFFASGKKQPNTKSQQAQSSLSPNVVVGDLVAKRKILRGITNHEHRESNFSSL